jgi:hypothetical protein
LLRCFTNSMRNEAKTLANTTFKPIKGTCTNRVLEAKSNYTAPLKYCPVYEKIH